MRKLFLQLAEYRGRLDKKSIIGKGLFILIGILSTIWFLVRVIPKPSRATYPCIQAVAPVMSGFVVYLLTITGTVVAFRNSGKLLRKRKYLAGTIAVLAGVISLYIAQIVENEESYAAVVTTDGFVANNPIGDGYGINPGRVVWVHEPDATNQNMTNIEGDYWWMEKNTDQDLVQDMLDDGIKKLTLKATVKDSWLELFKYHDTKLGRSNVGYSAGDKIYIKVNLVRSGQVEVGSVSNEFMDTSPQVMLAVLKQLIDEAGVDEMDITMGDPFKTFRNNYYNKLDAAYPKVTWMDNLGGNGRVQTVISSSNVFHSSDGQRNAKLPQAYVDAKYMINISCLKLHHAAGITMNTKNHQGSLWDPQANRGSTMESNMMGGYHYCFPNSPDYTEKGKYRHLVDYMGHEYMGGNTVLNIVDGLWAGGQNNNEDEPVKYQMAPFNNDYTSSVFLSQDKVAIEAVCFDFITHEYSSYAGKHGTIKGEPPTWSAVPDYLEQAADPLLRDIDYDPEDDGTVLPSLGVFEHWNSAVTKQYSQNLTENDINGIHLVSIPESLALSKFENPDISSIEHIAAEETITINSLNCFPNPASGNVNIGLSLTSPTEVNIELYSLAGKRIAQIASKHFNAGEQAIPWNISNLNRGTYLVVAILEGKTKVSAKLMVN